MALFQRQLKKSAQENRRREFQNYLRSLLKCELVRENYHLFVDFLELPLTMYRDWYVHSFVMSVFGRTAKTVKSEDWVSDNLKLDKGMQMFTGLVDQSGKSLDQLSSTTSNALRKGTVFITKNMFSGRTQA